MKNAVFLLCFGLVPLLAGAQPIVWSGATSMAIGRRVALLEDPTGKLTIDQVSGSPWAGQFVDSDKEILNFGFTESAYWAKFSVTNPTRQTLWLEVAQPFLPVTDLYVRDRDRAGHWQVQRAGYTVNLDQKRIKHINQVFVLPNTTDPVYVRFVSYSHPIPLKLWHDQAFAVKANKQILFYGLYVGILLFVIINNLFLFFSLRRFVYLAYSGLVLVYIFIAACVMDGFILYLLPGTNLMHWYVFLPIINAIVSNVYGLVFLDVKKNAPGLYWVSISIIGYFLFYAVWYRYVPLTTALLLNQVLALVSLGLALVVGVQTGRRGNKTGYYYALAYGLFFMIVVVEATYIQTGKPPYFFELSHVAFALLLEVLVLAYALSKRFEWERRDAEKSRMDVQERLLTQTRENERLLLSQNETLEHEVAERTKAIVHQSYELKQSLETLKTTQTRLIQKEKMASLGELTAGIAHEIQNPLNFVNNFAEVSAELADELAEGVRTNDTATVLALSADLQQNMNHIVRNGQRASSIVRAMLEHSRSSTDERQPTDINALAGEYLDLAYHGMRAKDNSFNVQIITEFDPALLPIDVSAQEIGRVLLNLYNNAFYAVAEQQVRYRNGYTPSVSVRTHRQGNWIEIRIRDNGSGIPEAVKEKIFQPFFTTKPTGEGTGLGLSLSYDIITRGYGGELRVESETGQYTEFYIGLPVK